MSLLGPRLWFVPIVVAFVALELVVLRLDRTRTPSRYTGFRLRDSMSAPVVGAVAQVIGIGFRLVMIPIAAAIAPLSLFTIDNQIIDYAVAIIAWDFCFYWVHRLSHRTKLGWASHITHHESPFFNFSVALRLEWFPFIGLLIYPWMAVLGISTEAMAAAVLINGFYGGLVHTELVGELPRPIEWLLNTPWHHRTHHKVSPDGGSNFANTFIIWDRAFGTYEATDSDSRSYGVVGPTANRWGLLGTPLFRFVTIFVQPTWFRLVRSSTHEPVTLDRQPWAGDAVVSLTQRASVSRSSADEQPAIHDNAGHDRLRAHELEPGGAGRSYLG